MNNEEVIEDTLLKLGTPALSDDAIVLLTVKLIEARFPSFVAEMVSEEEVRIRVGGEERHRIYLTNMLAECRRGVDERSGIVDRYVRVLAQADIDERPTTLENLVTLVRDEQFVNWVTSGDGVAAQHIVADVWMVLAREDEHSVTTISRADAAKLSGDNEPLFSTGIRNVSNMLEGLSAELYGECYTFHAESIFYVSTVVVMDYVWEQMSELVDGDIVLGVPARDTVLFCGANNAKAIEELRREVDFVIRNGHHLVSETLLRRVNGKWQVFS